MEGNPTESVVLMLLFVIQVLRSMAGIWPRSISKCFNSQPIPDAKKNKTHGLSECLVTS